MADLDEFYSNPDILEAIKRNQQYATGNMPILPRNNQPPIGEPIFNFNAPELKQYSYPTHPTGTPSESSQFAPTQEDFLNVLKGAGSSIKDLYSRIKTGVTEGPYNKETGYDPRIGLTGPEVMLPGGIGTAIAEKAGSNILGSAGSVWKRQWPGRAGPGIWTQDVKNSLKNIANDVDTRGGNINEAIKLFKEANPNLNVTDTAVRQAMYRMRNEGPTGNLVSGVWKPEYNQTLENLVRNVHGTNTSSKVILEDFKKVHPEFNMSSSFFTRRVKEVKDKYRIVGDEIPDRDFTLGALGGSGRGRPPSKLKTESPGEAVNWLQSQKPVDEQWVRNWAKEANVPIKDVRGSDTKYMRLEPDNPPLPGQKYPTVRIPQDENLHITTRVKPSEIGNYFDTGIGLSKPGGQSISPSRIGRAESVLINESGMPYANPEAMDAALKWRLNKAPQGKNWLISEDMAPRLPKNVTTEDVLQSLKNPDQFNMELRHPKTNELMSTGAPLHNDIPKETPYSLNEEVDQRLRQQQIDREIIEYQDRMRGKAPHTVPAPQKGNLISTYDILKALYGTP